MVKKINSIIRPLTKKEVPQIINIAKLAFSDLDLYYHAFIRYLTDYFLNETINFSSDGNIQKTDRPTRELVVMEIDQQIVGISGIMMDEYRTPSCFWLNWTAIDPNFQRQGLGTELLRSSIQRAKRFKATKLYVDTCSGLKSAVNFYLKNGFKTTGYFQDYFGPNLHQIYLEKSI